MTDEDMKKIRIIRKINSWGNGSWHLSSSWKFTPFSMKNLIT